MPAEQTPTILAFEKPIYELEQKLLELRQLAERKSTAEHPDKFNESITRLEQRLEQLRLETYKKLTRWQQVEIARHPERPRALDFIWRMSDGFIELHGDRKFADDPAIVGGFGSLRGQTVMFIGHQKGSNTKANLYRNFGMANPEGYRKALRLMKLAEKFNKPIITLIDTPGAYPGLEAEQMGQAEAIARNLFEMARLKVPTIGVVIGEGASGGALGIAVTDKLFMLEHTWFSVISPESCSQILWRNWNHKEEAAEALKLSAADMKDAAIVDKILPEPTGGAHHEALVTADALADTLEKELKALLELSTAERIKKRIEKYEHIGVYKS